MIRVSLAAAVLLMLIVSILACVRLIHRELVAIAAQAQIQEPR